MKYSKVASYMLVLSAVLLVASLAHANTEQQREEELDQNNNVNVVSPAFQRALRTWELSKRSKEDSPFFPTTTEAFSGLQNAVDMIRTVAIQVHNFNSFNDPNKKKVQKYVENATTLSNLAVRSIFGRIPVIGSHISSAIEALLSSFVNYGTTVVTAMLSPNTFKRLTFVVLYSSALFLPVIYTFGGKQILYFLRLGKAKGYLDSWISGPDGMPNPTLAWTISIVLQFLLSSLYGWGSVEIRPFFKTLLLISFPLLINFITRLTGKFLSWIHVEAIQSMMNVAFANVSSITLRALNGDPLRAMLSGFASFFHWGLYVILGTVHLIGYILSLFKINAIQHFMEYLGFGCSSEINLWAYSSSQIGLDVYTKNLARGDDLTNFEELYKKIGAKFFEEKEIAEYTVLLEDALKARDRRQEQPDEAKAAEAKAAETKAAETKAAETKAPEDAEAKKSEVTTQKESAVNAVKDLYEKITKSPATTTFMRMFYDAGSVGVVAKWLVQLIMGIGRYFASASLKF
eukprot:Nk52_evm2s856 gene=Nk52_evmTU2s856